MPLRRIRSLLVVLAAVLATVIATVIATAAPAAADTGTGSVVGRIVSSSGSPVADLHLRLATGHSDAPNHTVAVTTDAQGAFSVGDVVPDLYTVVIDDPTWTFPGGWPSVAVSADATATLPPVTVVRAVTVRGTVVSSMDGRPIPGIPVAAGRASVGRPGGTDGAGSATTDAAGVFSIVTVPGVLTVHVGARFWFDAARTVSLGEASGYDFGTIALDPAGIVSTSVMGRSGRPLDATRQSVLVDGCRLLPAQKSSCPGVEPWGPITSLQLTPGRHTLRYEVGNPVTSAVRQVTRVLEVAAGRETALPPVVVQVDPAKRAQVERGTFRRGRAITMRVLEGAYIDGAQPHLRATIRVSGHVVRPTSLRWSTRASGAEVLLATLPKKWSTRKSLTVRAVVHGTSAYTGQSTPAVHLVRAR